MTEACIKHLGRLPSELNLSDEQVRELLIYHRIYKRAQNICPTCIEEDRKRKKTCFICGRKYRDDERGKTTPATDEKGAELLGALAKQSEKKKKMTEEEKKKAREKMLKQLKEAGVLVDKIE